MDMFYSRFKAEGLLSRSVGLEYRNIILANGGSVDAK
jgi:thimet oligopeptidase